MKIVLRIDGENKTFLKDHVEAINFRNALELNKEFKDNMNLSDTETYDKMIEFVVKVFDHKFSVEDVWSGLSVSEVQSEPTRIFHEVLGLGGLKVLDSSEETGNEQDEPGK